jgi:hypothetical protein
MLDEPGREILKSDESCISNPEIRKLKLDSHGVNQFKQARQAKQSNLRFLISEFEMQDSSDFKIVPILSSRISQIC